MARNKYRSPPVTSVLAALWLATIAYRWDWSASSSSMHL